MAGPSRGSPGEPVKATGAGSVSVLIVDASPSQRRFLRAVLAGDPHFVVVGEARSAVDAATMVERLRPSVVLLDLDLPERGGRGGGVEVIESIMAGCPTPIVAYTSGAAAPEAYASGAADVLREPSAAQQTNLDAYARDLRSRLRVASRSAVITHPRGRLATAAPAPAWVDAHPGGSPTQPSGPPTPGSTGVPSTRRAGEAGTRSPTGVATSPTPAEPGGSAGGACGVARAPGVVQLVVVGASTGGPAALADLLGELPGDLAAAVLVVQHMADGFLPGFALWLDALSALDVRLGAPGMLLAPGTVTLAPEGHNATVASGLRLCCQPAPVGQLHVPGVDAAFESVASLLGAAAIGVVLSGMGRDGAAGLKQLHDRGAVTYCQDAASCAVYGMPGAAHALGAVDFELPPAQIGAAILARSGRRARVAPPAAFDPASGAQVGW